MGIRSTSSLTLLGTLILILSAVGLCRRLDESLTERRWVETESMLRSEVLLLESEALANLGSTAVGDVQRRMEALGKAASIRITLIRDDGVVVADSASNPARMDNHGTRPELVAALTSEFGSCRRSSRTLGMDFMYVAKALRRDGQAVGWIRASVPTSSIESSLNGIQWVMAGAIAATVLSGLLLGWHSLKRLWKSLQAVV